MLFNNRNSSIQFKYSTGPEEKKKDANKLSYKQKLIVYVPLLLFDFFALLCSLPFSQGI